MDTPPTTTYRFGEFEVDVAAYSVRRGGQRLRLARQPMDLLLLLLERRQELVSRDEIARRLWEGDVFTDLDAGIRTAVLKIRRVLGDSSESPQLIETVPGKGYRLIAHVEVEERSTIREDTCGICTRDLFGCASPQLTRRVDKLCGTPERTH